MRERLAPRVEASRVEPLEGAGRASVHGATLPLEEAAVDDVLDQGVLEHERGLARAEALLEELESSELLQLLVEVALRSVPHRAEQPGGELPPQHRRALEHAARRLG